MFLKKFVCYWPKSNQKQLAKRLDHPDKEKWACYEVRLYRYEVAYFKIMCYNYSMLLFILLYTVSCMPLKVQFAVSLDVYAKAEKYANKYKDSSNFSETAGMHELYFNKECIYAVYNC